MSTRLPIVLIALLTLTPAALVMEAPAATATACPIKMQTDSNFAATPVMDRCDSGSSGGGGGCTTDCPLVWVSRVINGGTREEIENPLSRFDEFRVDRSDGDRIVTLSKVDYDPDNGDLLTPLEAIEQGDIEEAMLRLGLTDLNATASQVEEMLADEPQLSGVRDSVINLIRGKHLIEAARELLASSTPANVTVMCGPDRNPVMLHWVVAIPVMVPCSVGSVQTAVPIAVRVFGVEPIQDSMLGEKNSDYQANAVDLQLVTATGTATAKQLIGFSYRRHAVGAFTTPAKAWSADVDFKNLAVLAADTVDVRYQTGIPGVLASGGSTFASGDKMYYTYLGKLGRGYSTGALMTNNDAGQGPAEFVLNVSGESEDAPERADWLQKVSYPGQYGVFFDRWTGMMEFGSGYALAFETARTHDVWYHAEKIPSANGPRYLFNLRRSTDQPADTPSDRYESFMTFYSGATGVASVRTVGLPNDARYLFDIGDAPGDVVSRIDVSADPADAFTMDAGGNPITRYFRTILFTGHAGDIVHSGTASYATRIVVQGSDTHDVSGLTDVTGRSFFQGAWTPLKWGMFNVTQTGGATDDKVNVWHVDSPAIGSYYTVGLEPSDSTKVFAEEGINKLVSGTSSTWKRYVWGHSESAAYSTTYVCPVKDAAGECR